MVSLSPYNFASSQYLYVAEVTIPLEGYCSQVTPQYNAEYTIGTQYTVGTSTFIPVKISGTVTYQPKGSQSTKTKIFNEDVTIALPIAIKTASLTNTPAKGIAVDMKCCIAKGFKITSLLTLTFTA